MRNFFMTLGRWSGNKTFQHTDLNEEVVNAKAEEYLKECPDYQSMATQVLFWKDTGRVHNLVAVYDIFTKCIAWM